MYSRKYQLTHDMDCYFNLNGFPIHIATNGGIVPDSLGTVEELQEMQTSVAQIAGEREFGLNIEYLSGLNSNSFPSQEEWEEAEINTSEKFTVFDDVENGLPFHWKLYSHSFVVNARKGFFSFDRIKTLWPGFDIYMLIAWPKNYHPSQSVSIGRHYRLTDYFEYFSGDLKCWPLAKMLDEAELR